jgi:peptide/nickel transport system permease protein
MSVRKQVRILLTAGILLLILPVIVNHRPLYIEYKGVHYYPAFTGDDMLQFGDVNFNLQYDDVKMMDEVYVIMPLIPWTAGRSDLYNSYAGPFDHQYSNGVQSGLPLNYRHWLGTDGKGSDVLAGILSGFRYSALIALLALLIASIPGVILGSVAGYFGNTTLKISKASVPAFIVALIYLICTVAAGSLMISLSIAAILFFSIYKILDLILEKVFPGKINLAVDSIIMRCMEVLLSIPALTVIITMTAIVRPGVFNIAVILGVLLWPDITRFVRAQVLQVKEQDYILAARTLGFSNRRILFNHILRNGITPVIILLCFSFSNIILTEAGLSFLGAGIPPDIVTWGSLLASGRDNFDAWWLIVFPGLALLGVVYWLVTLADRYQQINKTKFGEKKTVI